MVDEIWKDIIGYEGLYQISSDGNCRSVDRMVEYTHHVSHTIHNRILTGKILNLNLSRGYHFVGLCKNNIVKSYRINRLVAIHFIPNPSNLPEVNHIDEIKTNNHVHNLEWCDAKYNTNYGTARKRARDKTITPIYSISKLGVITEYNSISDVVSLGFSRTAVQNCLKGWSRSSGGCVWKYYKSS